MGWHRVLFEHLGNGFNHGKQRGDWQFPGRGKELYVHFWSEKIKHFA
jgi:hypothetical protein